MFAIEHWQSGKRPSRRAPGLQRAGLRGGAPRCAASLCVLVLSAGAVRAGEAGRKAGDSAFEHPLLVGVLVMAGLLLCVAVFWGWRLRGRVRRRTAVFHQVIDLVPHMIWARNAAGRLLLANRAMVDRCGLSIKDLLWTGEVALPKWFDPLLRPAEEVIRTGRAVVRSAVRVAVPDEPEAAFQLTVMPFSSFGAGAVLAIAVDVTELTRSRESLGRTLRALQDLEDIVNRSPAVAVLWRNDAAMTVEFVSRNIRQFGWSASDFLSGERTWLSVIDPADVERVRQELDDHIRGGTLEFVRQYRLVLPSGERRWVEDRTLALEDAEGVVTLCQGVVMDITERRRAEEALVQSEERYRSLYSSMREGSAVHTMLYDEQGKPSDYRIVDVNPAYEAILGISRDQAVGALATELYGTKDPPYLDVYARVAETGRSASFDAFFGPMGRQFRVSVYSPARGMFATVFDDVTNQKLLEEKLRNLTLVDDLTGLYNRRGFFTLAEQEMKNAVRNRHRLVFLYADLDHLKQMNDSRGHQAGDRALLNVAAILRETFRTSDIIARLGGDEFVVLASETSDHAAETIRSRLREAVRARNERASEDERISISFGVAVIDPTVTRDVDAALSEADRLMYVDKGRASRS